MPEFANFAAVEREIAKVARELELDEVKRITREMGERAQKIAERVAFGDLGGDAKFSGWAPELATQLKVLRGGATILMPTRHSAGPWTVAEQGRNQGNASGFSGPGLNVRTGVTSRNKTTGALRKVRARKATRWNGYTTGKGTASKAVAEMDEGFTPIAEQGLRRVLVRHFDVT